uniref:Uncharacterized protein n=1 Tax=Timema poppense TaxID=170557 RepID=A0A7R9HFW9_TIMPO|nr:unnamed protein product [Timema poppensis]
MTHIGVAVPPVSRRDTMVARSEPAGLISEMPVRLTSGWGFEELYLPEEYDNPCFSSEGVEECVAGSTTLPDLWGKFDLLDSPLLDPCELNFEQGECDDVKWKWGGAEDEGSSPQTSRTVKHDCMWGGRCASHEHKTLSAADTVASGAPVVIAGHSVLKSNVLRTNGPPARPDTPQSLSEDDDDLELDSTCDDHRRVIVCVSEVLRVPETVPSTQTSVAPHVHSDHSYHLSKGAPVRVDHLGVQTPSDSDPISSVGHRAVF